jgi:hypothetical protein
MDVYNITEFKEKPVAKYLEKGSSERSTYVKANQEDGKLYLIKSKSGYVTGDYDFSKFPADFSNTVEA